MIRPASVDDLLSFKSDDPFYTRVLSLCESYGTGYDFVGFWVQDVGGSMTAAVSRFEDKFSLYADSSADFEEIAAFVTFQGAGALMYDASCGLQIESDRAISGDVLVYCGEIYNSDIKIYRPGFKELYTLLKACESEIFIVPEYLTFLSDVTHRSNLGKCTVLGTSADGVLASAVMTVSETEHAAILGAVSTHPLYRRRGLSRDLVRTLASMLTAHGRRAYVFSASEANTRFYLNSGFEIYAGFKEAFFK